MTDGGHSSSIRYDAAGTITPEAYAAWGARWVEEGGASIVGGCCGVGPAHMRQLERRLRPREGEDEERCDVCEDARPARHL